MIQIMEVKSLLSLVFCVGVNSPLPRVDKIQEVETLVPQEVEIMSEYDAYY